MDEPLVRYDGSGTSNKRWLHADERGSIIAHTNTSGSLIQTNSYDAFGVPAASNDGLFQYTGQLWLEDAGVYYYKNRTYHAELGVFMQTDPLGQTGGINLYAYVGGDPVNMVDPWGLEEDPPDIITVIGQRIDPCDRPGAICDPDELDRFLDMLGGDNLVLIDPRLQELIEGLERRENDCTTLDGLDDERQRFEPNWFLNTPTEEAFWEHYQGGSGQSVRITGAAWDRLQQTAQGILDDAGVTGTGYRSFSFYGSTEWNGVLGSAGITFEDGTATGVFDTFDFNKMNWGDRGFMAEVATRMVSAGAGGGGTAFGISAGEVPCGGL